MLTRSCKDRSRRIANIKIVENKRSKDMEKIGGKMGEEKERK